MRKLIHGCGILWLIASVSTHAAAGPSFNFPDLEYSAERVISGEEGGKVMKMTMRVYYVKNKERYEISAEGEQGITVILHHDKKLAWIPMDEMREYVEVAYDEQARYCSQPCVNVGRGHGSTLIGKDKGATFVGKEIISGMETDKYKMDCIDKDGNTTKGFLWVIANGQLPVKMDFTLTNKAGRKLKHMLIEVRNIKFAKQDPSLFEVPKGYSKIPGMPMGGGMGGMPRGDGAGEMPMDGAGMKDMLKGVLGR